MSLDGAGDGDCQMIEAEREREDDSPLHAASAAAASKPPTADDLAAARAALVAATSESYVAQLNPYQVAAAAAPNTTPASKTRIPGKPSETKGLVKKPPGKTVSPEKKMKSSTEKQQPLLSPLAPSPIAAPGLAEPPVFGGGNPAGILGASGNGLAPGSGLGNGTSGEIPRTTEFYNLDQGTPSWVNDLREMFQGGQREMMSELKNHTKSINQVTEQVSSIDQKQQDMAELQRRFQSRLDNMEEEMKDLRAGRSVSPAPLRSGPGSSPRSTTASGGGNQPIVDDLQLVIGGWQEAKKGEVEAEIRRIFETLEAGPLLKDIHVPFIRTNFARVELQFGSSKLAERRQVQSLTLKALKKHFETHPYSSIQQQSSSKLWASRNRSREERAKIRALVGVKEYCARYVSEMFIDLDWRGKLWIRGEQVLFHANLKPPKDDSLLLNDSRGDESGWWADLATLSRVLSRDKETIVSELIA